MVDKVVATLAEVKAGTLADKLIDVETNALHDKLANTLAVAESNTLCDTFVCVNHEA